MTSQTEDEDVDDHRTTGELLETLDADYMKCCEHVIRQLNVADRMDDGVVSALDATLLAVSS